jgi:hypothetical protein
LQEAACGQLLFTSSQAELVRAGVQARINIQEMRDNAQIAAAH